MERYDIAIIGTGPAGVSAAITATIRNKKIILLGPAKLGEKVQKAHLIQNYPGLPKISGKELAEAYQKHLEALNIAITDARVNAVYIGALILESRRLVKYMKRIRSSWLPES